MKINPNYNLNKPAKTHKAADETFPSPKALKRG